MNQQLEQTEHQSRRHQRCTTQNAIVRKTNRSHHPFFDEVKWKALSAVVINSHGRLNHGVINGNRRNEEGAGANIK